MKILKSKPFAILVMIASIVFACFYGVSTRPAVETPEGSSVELNMELPTAAYEKFVVDDANILSKKTEEAICIYNANWDDLAWRIMAVVTLPEADDPEEAAWDWGASLGLGSDDALLLLTKSPARAYVVAEGTFYDDFSNQSPGFVDNYTAEGLQKGDFDKAVLALMEQVHFFHEDDSYSGSGGSAFLAILLVIVVIVILIAVCSMIDSKRYSRWNARYGTMATPPVVYRPLLSWHRPGSSWYRQRRMPPPVPRPPRPSGGSSPRPSNPPMSGSSRPSGGGNYRPPRPPLSGGARPSSGSRPSSGNRPSSGGFGGGNRGSSFGSGSRSGGFGGGRSGSFGGGRSSGGSRGGGFGGRR